MANGKIRFGKQSGGELALVIPDGVANTEVIIPESGELVNKDYVDLKQSKSELAYDVSTSSYIPNTLASGAIIERGSNANGEYVKYADGTMICTSSFSATDQSIGTSYGGLLFTGNRSCNFPSVFISPPVCQANGVFYDQASWVVVTNTTNTHTGFLLVDVTSRPAGPNVQFSIFAIGRWK
mgnify:CR=1 FL=1